MHIRNWKAKRSGAAITVKGKTRGGEDITVGNVGVIEPRGRMIVAVARDSEREYILEPNL